jgi:hypothetical protein
VPIATLDRLAHGPWPIFDTGPMTACLGVRSFRRDSCRVSGGPVEEDRSVHSSRGVRADSLRAARHRGSALTVSVRPKLKLEVVVDDAGTGKVVEE